jgi:DNA-binding PadR family transcriptional regulator
MEATGLTSGTIYPGFATSEWEDGKIARSEKRPPRRYYVITEEGEKALAAAMQRYRSLASVELKDGMQAPVP